MLTAIVTRLRALGETGRGGEIKPANLAASNGAVATTITATRQVSGLVMDVVDHSHGGPGCGQAAERARHASNRAQRARYALTAGMRHDHRIDRADCRGTSTEQGDALGYRVHPPDDHAVHATRLMDDYSGTIGR